MWVYLISQHLELDRCINNRDLLSDRRKKGNTNTHTQSEQLFSENHVKIGVPLRKSLFTNSHTETIYNVYVYARTHILY